jgi:hypothetical protein
MPTQLQTLQNPALGIARASWSAGPGPEQYKQCFSSKTRLQRQEQRYGSGRKC